MSYHFSARRASDVRFRQALHRTLVDVIQSYAQPPVHHPIETINLQIMYLYCVNEFGHLMQ